MKNGFDLKSALFCIAFTLYSCLAFSQLTGTSEFDSKSTRTPDMKSGISFSISPYVVNKAKATPLSGPYHLTTSYKNGFEAGPNYNINLNNSYSIIIGLHGGAAATNYKLFISESDFTPNLGGNVDDNGRFTSLWDFYISAPIWLEKRWFTRNNSFWDVVAGVNIRYYPIRYYRNGIEEDYPDVSGNTVQVLKINDSIGNNLRPWINYNIGGGYSLLLRNNNYLQCNLVANFSDKKIIDGTYQINVSGKPQSTGTYSETGRMLGYHSVTFLPGPINDCENVKN